MTKSHQVGRGFAKPEEVLVRADHADQDSALAVDFTHLELPSLLPSHPGNTLRRNECQVSP